MSTAESDGEQLVASLTPVLSERWMLSAMHLTLCGGFGLLFMYLNYTPLFYTDLWCHVAYGGEIVEQGALPSADPFMPLAKGMRVVDYAWLAQVVLYAFYRAGGGEALSTLFAVVGTATSLVYLLALQKRCGNLVAAALGVVLALALAGSRYTVIRPEMFGGLCFAILCWWLAADDKLATSSLSFRGTIYRYLPLFALFVVWANMHGSFLVGLAVLGCRWLGGLVESAWKDRRWQSIFADADVRCHLVQLEVAIVAALVNPYGIDLFFSNLSFGTAANLKDVTEWYPVDITMADGWALAFAIALSLVIMRFSRLRIRVGEVLVLAVFALGAAKSVRMIGWFAPLFVYTMLPHLLDVWNRAGLDARMADLSAWFKRCSFRWTLCAGLVLWVAFVLSPTSTPLFSGQPRPDRALYDRGTPLSASTYLIHNPPGGLVYLPQWWGDWLAFQGPPNLQPFQTSNVHLIPRQVWADGRAVSQGQEGWQRVLDRYNVQTIVIDKRRMSRLLRLVRRSAEWRLDFEDEQSLIATRRVEAAMEHLESMPAEPPRQDLDGQLIRQEDEA